MSDTAAHPGQPVTPTPREGDAAVTQDAAATLGVATTAKDPATLSAQFAEDAVRQVHDLDDVAAESALTPQPDKAIPGANFVDALDDPAHPRYWVGMSGEVLATSVQQPRPGPNPELQPARARYTAAVEAVRLQEKVAMDVQLYAVPDTYVPGAFFVHEGGHSAQVRWVDASGGAHEGYQLLEGAPRWDEATVAARREALSAQASTAHLVDDL